MIMYDNQHAKMPIDEITVLDEELGHGLKNQSVDKPYSSLVFTAVPNSLNSWLPLFKD